MKKVLSLLLATVMLLSMLAGCGGNTNNGKTNDAGTTGKVETVDPAKPSPSQQPSSGTSDKKDETPATTKTLDVLKVGMNALPTSMDPRTSTNNALLMVMRNVFDNLVYKDGFNGYELTSDICESWTNINETTYEFVLKDGITFHDGSPLTSEDVEFSFESALHCPEEDKAYYGSTLTAIMEGFKDVEVIDEKTFRIVMDGPSPILFERLSSVMGFYIVPKAYIEKVGNEEFGINPIGTGPYKVVENTKERLVMEVYDGFYGEKPTAQRVEYIFYPEVSTRLTALLNGEVDMIIGLTPEHIKTVADAGMQVNSVLADSIHMLCFNSAIEPMDDINLRKALKYSIDRELLAETIWSDYADVLNSYNFPNYNEYYVEDFPAYEYNPELAKEYLAKSDYKGETIYYDLKSGYYTLGNEVAEAISSMWADIGVNVEVRYQDKWMYDEFHVHNWSNGPRWNEPLGGLWLLWGTGTRADRNYWQNRDTWAEFVAQADIMKKSFDFQERYDANVKMLELWEEEVPGTVLFQISEIAGIRQGLEFKRTADFYIDFRAGHLNVAE